MKKIIQLVATTLLMVVTLYSCKKKEEPAPAAATTTGTTTSGTTTSGTTTSGTTTSGTTSGTTTSTSSPKTALLVNKTWVMTACTFSPPIPVTFGTSVIPVDDLFKEPISLVATCAKDDELKFAAASIISTSGTYTRIANQKCDGEGDDAGNWSFNSTFSEIATISTQSSSKSVFNILELTNTVFRVKTMMKNPTDASDTKEYEATITFGVK